MRRFFLFEHRSWPGAVGRFLPGVLGLWLWAGIATAPAAAQSTPQDATQDALVAEGRKLAAERCARCHGIGETDPSTHPKAPPFRLVVERYPSENLAEALAEGIVAGHPDMPVIVLQPDEIETFLAYLDSLGPAGVSRTAPKRAK